MSLSHLAPITVSLIYNDGALRAFCVSMLFNFVVAMIAFLATRQLKQRFPDARVIIVSNHDGEDFRKAAQALGVCGFVHKAHLEQLQAIIEASATSSGDPTAR